MPKQESSEREISKGPPKKRSQFACIRCRNKKAKCDAQQPHCSFCRAAGVECIYDSKPTLTYVRSLEERIGFLEGAIVALDADIDRSSRNTDPRLAELVQGIRNGQAGVSVGRIEKKESLRCSKKLGERERYEGEGSERSLSTEPVFFPLIHKQRHQQQLRYDEEGHLAHHGPTSFFYASGQGAHHRSSRPDPSSLERGSGSSSLLFHDGLKSKRREGRRASLKRARLASDSQDGMLPTYPGTMPANFQLTLNSTQERESEWYAYNNLAKHFPQYSQETYKRLLDLHWCWINPIFNFLYRPAFTREMASYPQSSYYFSPFLLFVVLAHSTRFDVLAGERGQASHESAASTAETFLQYARVTLVRELDAPGTIATCQGLLLLSAAENSRGHVSQAWQYSGLAFRMMTNLGIHLDGELADSEHRFTNEEIELRKRLFWSCYVWDKIISLYFGRAPVIERTALSPSRELQDQYGEIDVWMPLSFNAGNDGRAREQEDLDMRPAYAVSCFAAACQQSEALHHILIYQNSGRQSAEYLERASKMLLDGWEREVVDNLKIDTNRLPDICPPAHISNLNCLHHAFHILLERSQNSTAMPSQASVQAALDVITISRLHRKTYGKNKFVLSHAYCMMLASNTLVASLTSTRSEVYIDSLFWGFTLVSGMTARTVGLRRPVKRLAQRILHLSAVDSSPLHYVVDDYLARSDATDGPLSNLSTSDHASPTASTSGKATMDSFESANGAPNHFWACLDMDISQLMQDV